MTLKQHVLKLIVYQFGWRVVVAFYLVAYHLYLLVYLVLRIGAAEHYVCQHVDGLGDVVLVYGRVECGVFLVGKRVQVAAQLFQGVYHLQRIAAACALKRHVFAEVGHALLARQLIASARSHLIAAVHHLCHTGLMYYPKPAFERYRIIICHTGRKVTIFI